MTRRCVVCGESLPEKSRSDRRTCSARCRVALSRRLTGSLARLRAIEEAARALADPAAIHNGRQYDAKMAALGAALEAER
jgi:hypothetical protein